MVKVIENMIKELSVVAPELEDPEGYRDGKIVGDAEEICMALLMGDRTSVEYYTGMWDIRYPDGTPVWEWIPEAKGMREANII